MKRLVFSALVCLLFTGCYHKTDSPRGSWARGCDLSWLSEMERDGVKFYNDGNDGNDGNGENAIRFWAQNWRKDGLQERRNQLLKEYEFYNQTYCGCEFSMHPADRNDRLQREEHAG